MEFTKGEWEVWKDNPRMVLTDKGGYRPNASMLSLASKEEMVANAKLIAAAPDLLEALDKMSQCFQYRIESGEKLTPKEKQIWEQAEKAIEKALK